jgi:pyridoxamine 5'-phosphate oxidase
MKKASHSLQTMKVERPRKWFEILIRLSNFDLSKIPSKFQEENSNVAATIYWSPLRRCVRIEGTVEKIPVSESEAYFRSRPRASQIGKSVSPQSQPIPSREHLDEIESEFKRELGDEAIVPMSNWGGYLIVPRTVEFWQGQTNRLHDLIRFRKNFTENEVDGKLVHRGENGWVYERIAP